MPVYYKPNTTCVQCGKAFYASPYRQRLGRGRFCSCRCRGIGMTTPLIDRFFLYVGRKQPSGCILWTGAIFKPYGYGSIFNGNPKKPNNLKASRVSYELFVGPIPKGLDVLHRCDTPACINPVHLFLGTDLDNSNDKIAKGRHYHGERHASTKLTDADIREIRRRYAVDDVSQQDLADEFPVSRSAIGYIVRHKKWRHVQP